MVIHKDEKFNNVSENKIHNDTPDYNKVIIFFMIIVITTIVYAIMVYPFACSTEYVITNKISDKNYT